MIFLILPAARNWQTLLAFFFWVSWVGHVFGGVAEVKAVFPFLYVVPLPLFFFFADGVAQHVCFSTAGEKEKPAAGFWGTAATKACFPGLLFFLCSQPIGLQEIISHNSLLRKQETSVSPDDCEGAYSRKRGRPVQASVSFCSPPRLFWM